MKINGYKTTNDLLRQLNTVRKHFENPVIKNEHLIINLEIEIISGISVKIKTYHDAEEKSLWDKNTSTNQYTIDVFLLKETTFNKFCALVLHSIDSIHLDIIKTMLSVLRVLEHVQVSINDHIESIIIYTGQGFIHHTYNELTGGMSSMFISKKDMIDRI